jgi:NAD(P)-dependent dehydrogenase (short-subunit alcohol dehydrogenase family)
MHRVPSADATPKCVAVAGASGGIGSALCAELARRFPGITLIRLARHPASLPSLSVATVDIAFDISDESDIRGAAGQLPDDLVIDWLLVATGWLHDADHRPEKTFRSLGADHLLHAYRVNAVGPALLIKHLVPRLNLRVGCRLGILSARVGSISDNRHGGWHAYRASKAALNMLIRNYAIEMARKYDGFIIVGLQPGTTDTHLSRPFQRNLPEDQLQSPDFTANHLVDVVLRLQPEDSGGLFDFLGLPFEP